jgi:hypothetical protein
VQVVLCLTNHQEQSPSGWQLQTYRLSIFFFKAQQRKTIFMEDYLKKMQPVCSSRSPKIYPDLWIKQTVREPNTQIHHISIPIKLRLLNCNLSWRHQPVLKDVLRNSPVYFVIVFCPGHVYRCSSLCQPAACLLKTMEKLYSGFSPANSYDFL